MFSFKTFELQKPSGTDSKNFYGRSFSPTKPSRLGYEYRSEFVPSFQKKKKLVIQKTDSSKKYGYSDLSGSFTNTNLSNNLSFMKPILNWNSQNLPTRLLSNTASQKLRPLFFGRNPRNSISKEDSKAPGKQEEGSKGSNTSIPPLPVEQVEIRSLSDLRKNYKTRLMTANMPRSRSTAQGVSALSIELICKQIPQASQTGINKKMKGLAQVPSANSLLNGVVSTKSIIRNSRLELFNVERKGSQDGNNYSRSQERNNQSRSNGRKSADAGARQAKKLRLPKTSERSKNSVRRSADLLWIKMLEKNKVQLEKEANSEAQSFQEFVEMYT